MTISVRAATDDPAARAPLRSPRLASVPRRRTHAVAGSITIRCLQGSIEVQADGRWQTLHANDMVYLAGQAEHALQAITDTVTLVTILRLPAPP